MSITRTTISIDEGLLKTAKNTARRNNQTLGQLIAEAVQRHIVDSVDPQGIRKIVLSTAGHGGVRPGVNISSNAELSELLDEENLW